MGTGVFAFSFSISSLSSMLSNLDTKKANLNEKMEILNQIRRQYNLGLDLYRRVKGALKYEHQNNLMKKSNEVAFLN